MPASFEQKPLTINDIMNVGDYFTHAGWFTKSAEFYFDNDEGNVLPEILEYAAQNYKQFAPNSNLVALYYADKYADSTKGNYSAYTLFARAN